MKTCVHITAAAFTAIILLMTATSVAVARMATAASVPRASVHATAKRTARDARHRRRRALHRHRHRHPHRAHAIGSGSTNRRISAAPRQRQTTTTQTPSGPAQTTTSTDASTTPTSTTTANTSATSTSTNTAPTGTSVAFSSTSPWNVPIPAAPALDPNSPLIASYLGSELKAYADLYEFGTPVWEASSSDPYNAVTCTEPWGTCQLMQQPIPIPAQDETSSGSDGSMVVIDSSTHTGYDFWRASRTSATSWTTAWGTRFDMQGSGTGGGATGAGVPLLAGLPRLAEMTEGHINHALGFISDNTCASVYRYPASKTDGKSAQSDCIPEGARIQLDPSIDVDAIPGITPGEKIVAHALQTYGAYCKDSGGARLAFGFENPVGKSNPYPALGFSWDYYAMPHIPWNRLRVLGDWSGS